MILFAVVGLVFLFCTWYAFTKVDFDRGPETLGVVSVIVAIVAGIALLIGIIALPIDRTSYHSEIAQFKVKRQMITQRMQWQPGLIQKLNAIDSKSNTLAEVWHEALKMNTWLESVKAYNRSLWDIWIPDEVEELKPIGIQLDT